MAGIIDISWHFMKKNQPGNFQNLRSRKLWKWYILSGDLWHLQLYSNFRCKENNIFLQSVNSVQQKSNKFVAMCQLHQSREQHICSSVNSNSQISNTFVSVNFNSQISTFITDSQLHHSKEQHICSSINTFSQESNTFIEECQD